MSDNCTFPLCKGHAVRDGFCIHHAKHYAGPKPAKEKVGIAPISEKRKKQLKEEKPNRDKQNEWFAEVEAKEFKNGGAHCWNCGEFIHVAFARAATAHILPKRKNMFPSVATHPENYLILGAGCGCHSEYDRSWDDASKMQVWPKVVERFLLIKDDIKDATPIPDVFINALKNTV